MIDSFKNLFYSVDIFGIELQFRKKEGVNFTTIPGAILSILIYFSLIILSFIFGKEIYERKLPKVNSGFEIAPGNSTDVLLSEFKFGFTLRNSLTTKLIKYGEYYSIDIRYWDFFKNVSNINYTQEVTIKPCEINNFNEELIKDVPFLDEFLCFDFKDKFLRNEKSGPNSFFVTLEVKLCDSNIKKCPKDIDIVTTQMFSNTIFEDSFINPKNKDSILMTNLLKNPQNLNTETIKHTYYKIVKNKLIIDYGWILEDEKSINHLNTYLSAESMVKSNKNIKTIQIIYFETATKISVTNIRYMKAQDLLANIGGLFNGLVIIGTIIIKHYINFLFYINSFDIMTKTNNECSDKYDRLKSFFKLSNFNTDENSELRKENHIQENNNNNIKSILSHSNLKDNINTYNNNINLSNISFLKNKNEISLKIKNKTENKLDGIVIDKENSNSHNNSDDNKCLNSNIKNSNLIMKENLNDRILNVDEIHKIISEEMIKFSSSLKKSISEEMNDKNINAISIKNKKYLDMINQINNADNDQSTSSYFTFLSNYFFCCKKMNKKEEWLTNYILSYDRFISYSMTSITLNS